MEIVTVVTGMVNGDCDNGKDAKCIFKSIFETNITR